MCVCVCVMAIFCIFLHLSDLCLVQEDGKMAPQQCVSGSLIKRYDCDGVVPRLEFNILTLFLDKVRKITRPFLQYSHP